MAKKRTGTWEGFADNSPSPPGCLSTMTVLVVAMLAGGVFARMRRGN